VLLHVVWSESETAVTLIATSIPFLRLMFRELSRKSQPSRSGQDGYWRKDMTQRAVRDMAAGRDFDKGRLDSDSENSLPRISKESDSIMVTRRT
jgi:hypothetical protein